MTINPTCPVCHQTFVAPPDQAGPMIRCPKCAHSWAWSAKAAESRSASADRLGDLLLQWEELFEQGQNVPAEELCRDCPELTPLLVERIEALKTVAWVNRREGNGDRPKAVVAEEMHHIRLRGVSADIAGRTWESCSVLRVGRADGLEITLQEGSVSRLHGEIHFCDGNWWVRDLDSVNGTYVNGNRLESQEDKRIRVDDLVRFGNVLFAVDTLDWTSGKVPVWQINDIVLGRYIVTDVHQGGMGFVYQVRDTKRHLSLAMKSPRPEHFLNEEDKQAFWREAKIWENVGHHPNIVACYGTIAFGSTPLVFAEYIDGGTLAEWIRSRRLYAGSTASAYKRIVDIAIQIARGLQKAHLLDVIHQDIKPSNIMMTKDGIAKITDFGLARTGRYHRDDYVGKNLTIAASVGGGMTPAYCSPEQAQIEEIARFGMPKQYWPKLTRRTDIYSWAVTVVEMLDGALAWPRGDLLRQIRVLAERFHNMPAWGEIQQILAQCLSESPDDRPRTVTEIIDRLEQIRLHAGLCDTEAHGAEELQTRFCATEAQAVEKSQDRLCATEAQAVEELQNRDQAVDGRICLREIADGKPDGRMWDFSSFVRIGRLETLEMFVDDESLSRIHAEISLWRSGWILQDQGSTNGTYVNGQRVGTEGRLLHTHDIVRFGNVTVMVETVKPGESCPSPVESVGPDVHAEKAAFIHLSELTLAGWLLLLVTVTIVALIAFPIASMLDSGKSMGRIEMWWLVIVVLIPSVVGGAVVFAIGLWLLEEKLNMTVVKKRPR